MLASGNRIFACIAFVAFVTHASSSMRFVVVVVVDNVAHKCKLKLGHFCEG